MTQEKESFISSEQRPGLGLRPDTPISELRVRDLQTLLQGVYFSFSRWNSKVEVPPWKTEKSEKIESPNGKEGGNEKNWKDMKHEKSENKTEKDEIDTGPPWSKFNQDNERREFMNPAMIDQLIRTVSGLHEQVAQLTQEVEKLKQRSTES